MQLVAEASNGREALEQFREHRPDVTLMDLQLPVMSGLAAIQAIRAIDPAARIVVLTMYQGEEDIHRALQAGAAGFASSFSPNHSGWGGKPMPSTLASDEE